MINKERGIILSEKRSRDSVSYRTQVAQLEFLEAGTRVPQRLPIGLQSVIENSSREPFLQFYNQWYRPDLMAVVVVGDIDPEAIEKQIVSAFSGLTPRAPEPPPVDLGSVAQFKGNRFLFHPEPEAPDTQIVIASTVPDPHHPDTAAYRLSILPRSLAIEMLNRRLSILAKKENAPFIRASTNVEESFNLYRESEIEISCRGENWSAALGVADQELRRAQAFGFRADELKEAVADFRNDLEQGVKTAPTRRSEDLAEEIAEDLLERNVFTSPADDLALFRPALDRITPADCVLALRSAWTPASRYVFVSGNAKIPGDATAAIAAAYDRSQAIALSQPPSLTPSAWAYVNFGPPGKVAEKKHIDDLDITEVTFENGVRLDLKKTDFEANTIHVAARLGTGQLTEPAATEPGLSAFTGLTFTAGGLGKHSADDLTRILAGRTVESKFASTLDAFVLSGSTNREDLRLEFELLTASIADPGYRPEAQREARKRIDSEYNEFAHTSRGPLALEVGRLLASGDPRFGLPPKAAMMARSLDEEKAWLAPTLASGALEVSIAGDFDLDAAIAARRPDGRHAAEARTPAGARRSAKGFVPEPSLHEGFRGGHEDSEEPGLRLLADLRRDGRPPGPPPEHPGRRPLGPAAGQGQGAAGRHLFAHRGQLGRGRVPGLWLHGGRRRGRPREGEGDRQGGDRGRRRPQREGGDPGRARPGQESGPDLDPGDRAHQPVLDDGHRPGPRRNPRSSTGPAAAHVRLPGDIQGGHRRPGKGLPRPRHGVPGRHLSGGGAGRSGRAGPEGSAAARRLTARPTGPGSASGPAEDERRIRPAEAEAVRQRRVHRRSTAPMGGEIKAQARRTPDRGCRG